MQLKSKGSLAGGVDELGVGGSLAVAGESGAGKTILCRAIAGILPTGVKVSGSVRIHGEEVLNLPRRKLRRFRGSVVSMVFHSATTSLNPVTRVGKQVQEAVRIHGLRGRRESWSRVLELLELMERRVQ